MMAEPATGTVELTAADEAFHVCAFVAAARIGVASSRHTDVAERVAEREGSWRDAIWWARRHWNPKARTETAP